MEWILVFCTNSFVLCGQIVEAKYPSEESCYRAMDELYRRHGKDEFKWVLCKPAEAKPSQEVGRG